jgi:two-component system, sensor histidine kinase and response regulator
MADLVKFLLVDDVAENLVALEALLRRDGLELHAVQSGREALELLLRHDFALAFLDVQMPEMDGFELAELMRGAERSRHVPIIFVTAGQREPHRIFQGYESGAVDFLFKPIDPHVLRHKADVFFELYRQRQQLAAQIEERERLIAEVQETLRLNETFAAALGHDLRNPLSAIITGAAVLIRRSSDEQTMAIGNRILTSGSRMARLIEQLLDLARARLAGGIPVSPVDLDLKTVADRVVAEHQPIDSERTIATDADGDLRGVWDDTRISQVISNLLGNALQHGAVGGGVSLQLDGTGSEQIRLTVTNPGVIHAETLPHLFEPFRSGRHGQRRSEGLGLGLYIVDQIVKAHGGTIEVRSGDGTTTFDVRLPRVTEATKVTPGA